MCIRLSDPAFQLNYEISVGIIISLALNKEIFFFFRWHILFVGHAVAKLVEALRYKPGGHEFDSRWCHLNFSFT